MTRVLVSGPDGSDLAGAFEDVGAETVAVEGVAGRPSLEEAGVHEADFLVITDVGDATAVPVAKDMNDDLRVIVYATDTVPEFVRGQAELILDPALFEPATVAEELVG